MSSRSSHSSIRMMTITALCVLVIGILSLLQETGSAQSAPVLQGSVTADDTVPSLLNYQGVLRNQEGVPLSGEHTITFRIYDDPSAPAGDALWSEQHTGVVVRDGQFSAVLGDISPIDLDLFDSPERFIGVTVAPFDEMVPRQRFASVPYAVHADNAKRADQAGQADQAGNANLLDNKDSTAFAAASHAHSSLNASDGSPTNAVSVNGAGNVGIGTTAPSTKLDVNGNLRVRGNLSVDGNFSNFTFTGPHNLDLTPDSSTNRTINLGSTSDRMCFLTSVLFQSLDEGGSGPSIPGQPTPTPVADGFGSCTVKRSGSQWQLQAMMGSNSDNDIFCAATCMRW